MFHEGAYTYPESTISGAGTLIEIQSGGSLTLERGSIETTGNSPAISIAGGATLEIPEGSTTEVTSSGGEAISLANGANVKMDNTTVTANGDTGNYIDNNGVAVLAAGATNESNTLRAAVMLTDGMVWYKKS